jgi:DNA replication protein DnaC
MKYLLGQLAGSRFASKTFENFIWTDTNIHLKEFFYNLAEKHLWEKGVGIVGEVGVGKTHLLSALYKNRVWYSVFMNGPIPVWLSFFDLVAGFTENKMFIRDLLDTYDLVFVDDIWNVGAGVNEKGIVRELVFRCYDANKILCYTANWSYEKWDVDERVSDRLREMCIEVELIGSSFRDNLLWNGS